MAVRTWRSAAALAIVALFFASGTVIASERSAKVSFTNHHLGARVGCLVAADPPSGVTDPGGWRQVVATSPAADHVVLVMASRLSDLRPCSSRPGVSAVSHCPAGHSYQRFLGCMLIELGANLVLAGGVAPEVGALTVLLPEGTALDAVVAGGAFVIAGLRAAPDNPDALRLRVSDHDGRPLYEGALFPPGT